MPYDKQLNELVLVFELENNQNSYARCLSAITYFENQVLNSNISANEFYSYIKQIPPSDFVLNINQRKNGSNDKMEHPINQGEYARIPVPPAKEEYTLAHAIDYWRENKEKCKRPFYHIRIKFDYNSDIRKYQNIDNLQFLAMFLQQVYILCFSNDVDFEPNNYIPNKLKERLSVFLIPYTGVTFQFAGDDKNADTSLYLLSSQYLRLITKTHNGVIYGKSSIDKVEAVNFEKRTRNTVFFPLLYLGNTEFNNYNLIFETSGMPDISIIEKGFTYKVNENDSRPFNDAGNKNPHSAMADLLLDETRARLYSFFASVYEFRENTILPEDKVYEYGRLEIQDYIEEIKTNIINCDRLTYALFGYLLFSENKSKTTVKKAIKHTMDLSRELGDGIRQIVQNSLQHSQYQICFISLSKLEILNSENKSEKHLSVRVTDINSQKTLVETFINTLKSENKFDIFNINDIKISLNQLISDFDPKDENVLTAWGNYRSKDTSAHIGLTIFRNILDRCDSRLLQIMSSTAFKLEPTNIYTKNLLNLESEKPLFPGFIIPGTQINFIIPIKEVKNSSPVNLVQLGNNDSFKEDYVAFAHYLDYKISDIIWISSINILNKTLSFTKNINITDAKSKYDMQQNWKLFWSEILKISSVPRNDKDIHLCELIKTDDLYKYLEEKDNCEIFIKGFFAAASLFAYEDYTEDSNNYLCFYLTNLPSHFIYIFQEVGSSLSLMSFPRNLQFFLSCKDETSEKYNSKHTRHMVVLGNRVGHVIQNAYIMSLEHGERNIDTAYYTRTSELMKIFKKTQLEKNEKPLLVCPFNVIKRRAVENGDLPLYFKQIRDIVEKPLVNEDPLERGYRLPDIHMRLGNKVHVGSFYEMSFLFYRTSIANRVAFYILQDTIEELKKMPNDIVFYGYASYSQALIFSLQEILKKYFEERNIKKEVHYAIYQYNLQLESFLLQSVFPLDNNSSKNTTVDRVQVYSTLELQENEEPRKTSVVQIVPIGSTLTTFDKMRAKYKRDRDNKNIEHSSIKFNYNVFLIRDKNVKIDKCRSIIEKDLWLSIDSNKMEVEVNTGKLKVLSDNPVISYIIERESDWQQPLRCKHCFPDILNEEIPIVETDPTSTVPTLQIYQNESSYSEDNSNDNLLYSSENNEHLFQLQDCVYYGHFLRGKNHYQYYIDTQKYISKKEIKKQLKKWLITEKENDINRIRNEKDIYSTPVLNVIFSPEHNSNVGFSQYVNAYYFNGTAEIVSVNVDKQFRSNFVCEHDALRKIINHLLNEHEGQPINFFYVDDCIITGSSFHRAKMLIQSLIPDEYRPSKYESVFSKCFILIDRLSMDTKESYVNYPKENFLSFCKVNISNMRKQGDSCVGCKLEYEAKYLFKRSATRSFANYWAKKALEYTPIMYDDTERRKDYGNTKAFVRMLLTHFIESYFDKKIINYENISRLFDNIFDVLKDKNLNANIVTKEKEVVIIVKSFEALRNTGKYTYEQIIVCIIEHLIKILSRPFKSYNFNVKTIILRFIINICESLFTGHAKDETTGKICNIVISAGDNELKTLDFVKNSLFEALADMRSTYFLRKETIKKIYEFTKKFINFNCKDACNYCNEKYCNRFVSLLKDKINYPCDNNLVRCFWKYYSFNIHKVIDSSGDETRSLWMEFLLLTGTEYQKITDEKNIRIMKGILSPLYNSIVLNDDSDKKYNKLFKEFCIEIFLQNSRLLFDGIEKIDSEIPETDPTDNSYFLQNMTYMRNWDLKWASVESEKKEEKEKKEKRKNIEKELFDYFMKNGNDEKKINEKYKNFIQKISDMIVSKYNLNNKLRIVLLTQNCDDDLIEMNNLDFIAENTSDNYSKLEIANAKYIIKKRIIWALRANLEVYSNTRLINDGYCLIFSPNYKEQLLNDNCSDNPKNKVEFDINNDSTSFRKPFFILRFDNIPICDEVKLAREAKPIEKVYLYISFDFALSEKKEKEIIVPLLIMRDILSYRNRIMRMLEKDFNSQLMQAWAREAGENAILKHEKSIDHSTNIDDLLSHKIWGTKKQLKEKELEWLLFRNNTNIQIAKLFNRLLLGFNKSHNQLPKLYLKNEDINYDNTFSTPAKEFLSDLWNGSSDKRVNLCEEIIDFSKLDLENALLITKGSGDEKEYFNLEFFKCIFYDIFLSCAKFWNEDANFLSRINTLIEYKEKYNEFKDNNDPDFSDARKIYEEFRCKVILFRSDNNLVIINPVRRTDNKVFNGWNNRTEQIIFQLENPYDSFNGNMSLYTINNYIKYITNKESSFKYILFKDIKHDWKGKIKSEWKINQIENESLWFISELPIFGRNK